MSEVITRHSVLVLRCMYRESYTAYYQDQQIHYIYMYIYIYIYIRGPRWHSGQGAVLQIGMLLVRSQLVSLDFSLA